MECQRNKSKYEPGFVYYTERGELATLIAFEDTGGGEYRWKAGFIAFPGSPMEVTFMGWTDDCWIDVAIGKAFLNKQTHQIVYYDEVDIVPKQTTSKTQ